MTSKVCIITGANTGIGRATAAALAAQGHHLFLAGRSRERTLPVIAELKRASKNEHIEFIPLDLTSLQAVQACAREFLARSLPLHLLINNAGIAGHRGVTSDGFELQFGVNHLAHFALTIALLDRMRTSAPARIVTVSSHSHYQTKEFDLSRVREPTKSITALPEYALSKLCNVLFSAELSRREAERGIHTYSVHPGVIASDIWRRLPGPIRMLFPLFMKSSEEGAKTTLYCATSDAAAKDTGLYYDQCAQKKPSRLARDPELATRLWQFSEDAIRVAC
jgi:retinol dehydrogenase-12